jgi:co-chaperonin GroES (HSP10)
VNGSGIRPCGTAVLLLVTELKEKTGALIIPERVAQSSAASDSEGIVVAIGENAWKGEPPRAKIGERVAFTLYSGGLRKGRDGLLYRLIKADAIYAVIEP